MEKKYPTLCYVLQRYFCEVINCKHKKAVLSSNSYLKAHYFGYKLEKGRNNPLQTPQHLTELISSIIVMPSLLITRHERL